MITGKIRSISVYFHESVRVWLSVPMKFISTIFFFLIITVSRAAVVSGIIRNENGEFLPFATIYIKELDYGTTSNLEGYYEIALEPGTYTFMIQYLGYSTLNVDVRLGEEDLVLNVRLKTRSLILPNLTYQAGSEDPAYAIMRRVIARSKFHQYQLQAYTTEVYVKGSGRLIKSPFFLRNRLKKEGIDSTRVFMSESLSEIKFKLPNTYTQRIISVNTTENENAPDPMPFIKSSFYQPRVADALSPISPVAFNHYQFRYDGFFEDQGVVVNKIHVKPKVRGDIVFEGFLYIVEGLWAIHSLDFDTFYQGFDIHIQQIYHPILPEVWMPVTHKFDVEGSFMGFDFEFKYVAVNTDYEVTLNEQLILPDTDSGHLPADSSGRENQEQVPFDLQQEQALSKKEIRKIMRETEKQALREVEQESGIVYRENFEVDSGAYTRDSSFWERMRPVPLSILEYKSLERKDSLVVVHQEEATEDSLREEKNKKFRFVHILSGNEYALPGNSTLSWRPLWNKLSFNSVEGWNLNAGLDYTYRFDSIRSISIGPTVRYGFSSKQWYGQGYAKYDFKQHLRSGGIKISGGKYIYQINRDNPIPFWLNMISTLFFRENFMKLYARDFAELSVVKPFSPYYEIHLNAGWSRNYSLRNNTDYSFSNQNKEFSSNNPENVVAGETVFEPYQLYSVDIALHYFPFLKFYERNGVKHIIQNSSPQFILGYSPGYIPDNGQGFVYHAFRGGIRYGKTFGVDNRFEMYVAGSGIFNGEAKNLPFPEFHHFSGNQTPLLTENLFTSFRMLDYYFYSTNKYHAESHLLYQFRKLLLTQIIYTRLAGIREDLMFRYLHANTLPNYMEVGYALDNLFNFFRIELIGQFKNLEYQGLGFRIGFSKNLAME
jgi:hypothetical protein